MFESKSKVLIVLLMLSLSYRIRAHSSFHWGEYSSEKKVLVMAGWGILAVGSAAILYKLVTREPSNEALYARARDVYEALCDRYGAMELLDCAEALVHYTEQDLTGLVSHRDMKNMPRVESDLCSLWKERDKIQTCIRRDVPKDDTITSALCVLLHEMNQLGDKLKHMKLFWEEHAHFFELYQDVRNLTQQYKKAFGDIYDQTVVKRTVMEKCIQPRSEDQDLWFSEMLKHDIKLLCDRMNTMQCYTVLYGEADRLEKKLSSLQEAIANLPEYKEEYHLKE